MAAITVNVANLVPEKDSMAQVGILGGTIAAGKLVYRDSTTGKWLLADWDTADTPPVNADMAITLSGGVDDQRVGLLLIRQGNYIDFGAVLTQRQVYVCGDAGAINPIADIGAGDYLYLLGYAETTSRLRILGIQTGIN